MWAAAVAKEESRGRAAPAPGTRLEEHLTDLGAPVAVTSDLGADPRHIDDVLGQRGLTASQELHARWGWHDGTDVASRYGGAFVPLADAPLLATWHLPSVEEAARGCDQLQRSREVELPRGWWPVLDMSLPAVLCADTVGGGALFLVDGRCELPADPPEPLATSLTDFAELLLDLFGAGAVLPSSPEGEGPSLDRERLPRALPFPLHLAVIGVEHVQQEVLQVTGDRRIGAAREHHQHELLQRLRSR